MVGTIYEVPDEEVAVGSAQVVYPLDAAKEIGTFDVITLKETT
jgi:hypothetical protein